MIEFILDILAKPEPVKFMLLSFVVFGVVFALHTLCVLAVAAKCYVYDEEYKRNKLLVKLYFTEAYIDGHHLVGFYVFFLVLVGVCSMTVVPVALWLAFNHLWVVVVGVALYAGLRLSRAVIRLKNKVSSHIADLNAHKEK